LMAVGEDLAGCVVGTYTKLLVESLAISGADGFRRKGRAAIQWSECAARANGKAKDIATVGESIGS